MQVPRQPGSCSCRHHIWVLSPSTYKTSLLPFLKSSVLFGFQTSYLLRFCWLFTLFFGRSAKYLSWVQEQVGSAHTYLDTIFWISGQDCWILLNTFFFLHLLRRPWEFFSFILLIVNDIGKFLEVKTSLSLVINPCCLYVLSFFSFFYCYSVTVVCFLPICPAHPSPVSYTHLRAHET